MNYKTLHRKLKIKQHKHKQKPGMNSGDPERSALPVLHVKENKGKKTTVQQ